jgi:hypothetical protein
MPQTRVVVQLQQGTNHLDSVKMVATPPQDTIHWIQVAMMVRTLHARTCVLFGKTDQAPYLRAVDAICRKLETAMRTRFQATGGNQFRETFSGAHAGKRATYRIDIEIAGPISP